MSASLATSSSAGTAHWLADSANYDVGYFNSMTYNFVTDSVREGNPKHYKYIDAIKVHLEKAMWKKGPK